MKSSTKYLVFFILGAFSIAGIIQLISAAYSSIIQLAVFGSVGDPDALQAAAWLVLPTILSIFLFFKLIKKPEYFDKYAWTISLFVWGVVITVVVALILSGFVIASGDPFGILAVVVVALFGFLISFVLAIIGWIIDRKRA